MLDLSTFTRIVRPARTVDLNHVRAFVATEDPILFHGAGAAAVEAFARVAPLCGWGSAVALSGVPTASPDVLDRAEEIARTNYFRYWFRGNKDIPGFTEDARTWVKQDYDGDAYGTHREVLLEAVRRTTGPVLELGAGSASTPALHALCAETGRLLVTVDSDGAWLDRFRHLAHRGHILECLRDPAETAWLRQQWGVVFVDHSPGETRGKAIERARAVAEYCVVHDSEELGYALDPLLDSFRHRRDFRRKRPWTTVVSETHEIWRMP